MRVLALALPLLISGLPAASQDLAAEYMAAARVFTLPGSPNDPDSQLAWSADLVAALAGRWQPVWILLDDISTPEGLDRVAHMQDGLPGWCDIQAHEVRATGPRSFEMAVLRRGEDTGYAVRFQYAMGRSFQRSHDEMAFLNRLGLGGGEFEVPASVYAGTSSIGIVEVFHPSANVLVIQPQGGTAEMYVRCP